MSFPVLRQSATVSRVEMRSWPMTVPLALIDRWRETIECQHGQTIERLAFRGGLTPVELWLAAHDLELGRFGDITERDAATWLAAQNREAT